MPAAVDSETDGLGDEEGSGPPPEVHPAVTAHRVARVATPTSLRTEDTCSLPLEPGRCPLDVTSNVNTVSGHAKESGVHVCGVAPTAP